MLVLESAVDYIPGLEDKFTGGPVGRGLRYEGPGTFVSGNAVRVTETVVGGSV